MQNCSVWSRCFAFLCLSFPLTPVLTAQRVDLWQPVGAPDGAEVIELYRAPNGPIFARTENSLGPVFRSDDGGVTWVPASGGLPVLDLRQEQSQLGVGPGREAAFAVWDFLPGTLRFFHSTDGGGSWSEMAAAGFPRVYDVHSVAFPANGDLLLVAASFDAGSNLIPTIYASSDKGASWTVRQVLPAIDSFLYHRVRLAVAPDGTILSGVQPCGATFRSTDDGKSWSRGPVLCAIDLGFSGDTAFAVGEGGVYRSTDGGVSWNRSHAGLPDVPVWNVASTSPGTVFVTVAPFVNLVPAPGENGVYKSTDDGLTWSPAGDVFPSFPIEALANFLVFSTLVSAPDGGLLLGAGMGTGVRRSGDLGGTWSNSSLGLLASSPGRPSFGPDGTLFVSTGVGLARSSDGGRTWQVVEMPRPDSGRMSFGPGGRVFAPARFAPPKRSSDGGVTWFDTARVSPLPRQPLIFSSLIAPSGSVLLGTQDGIFRSIDDGASWGWVTGFEQTISSLVATRGGALLASGNSCIRRSSDDGVSWQLMVCTGIDNGDLLVAPNGNIYAGTERGVRRSTDDGLNWEFKPVVPDGSWISSVTTLSDGTLLALDSRNRIWSSTDSAETWTDFTAPFPTAPNPDFFLTSLIAGPDDELFVTTRSAGLFRGVAQALPAVIFPQFATGTMGAGELLDTSALADEPSERLSVANRTRFLLVNNGDVTDRGMIRFRNAAGELSPVGLRGEQSAEVPYAIPPRGTLDFTTDGTGTLQTGTVEVVSALGEASLLEGSFAFDLLNHRVSVGHSPAASERQIYLSRVGDENTGLALYNPDPKGPAPLELVLYDHTGLEQARREIDLGPRHQLVRFLDEEGLFGDFFDANPGNFRGTVRVTGLEGAEFSGLGILQDLEEGALIAVSTEAEGDPGRLLYTQFVDGEAGGEQNRTRLILMNTGASAEAGTIRFQDRSGRTVSLGVGFSFLGEFPYELEARSILEFLTPGAGPLQTGVIEVTSDAAGESKIAGTAIFEVLGRFVSVPPAPARQANQVYVSVAAAENTGVAIYNPDDSNPVTVTAILVDAGGRERARREIQLEASEQLVRFVDEEDLFQEFFDDHGGAFRGTLNLFAADGQRVAVLGLLQDASGALMATRTSPNAFDPAG